MRLSAFAPLCFFLSVACADDSAGISSGGKAVDASGGGDVAGGGGGGAGDGGSGSDEGSGSGTADDTAGDDGTTGDGGEDGTTGDGGGGDNGSGSGSSGPEPEIVSGQVTCFESSDSSVESFGIQLEVTDPQGDDTIASLDSLWKMSIGGSPEATGELACSREGACAGTVIAQSLGTSCDEGEDYLWEVNVFDEDGHSSGWTEVPWVNEGA
jgi:hypothetical protein